MDNILGAVINYKGSERIISDIDEENYELTMIDLESLESFKVGYRVINNEICLDDIEPHEIKSAVIYEEMEM